MTFNNLIFFVAFFGLAYLVNRMGETLRAGRRMPVRAISSTPRRPPGDAGR